MNIDDKFTQEAKTTTKHTESFKAQTVGLTSSKDFRMLNKQATKAATDIKNQFESIRTLKKDEVLLQKKKEAEAKKKKEGNDDDDTTKDGKKEIKSKRKKRN